jgi:hypothetical protein
MASIDFKTIPANVPSMCIPRVFKNITRDRIANVFRELDLGTIDRIDLIQRENEKGEKFQKSFVHFKTWHNNPNAIRAREMLLSGKEVKVIYDDPWFWKIGANKSSGSGSGSVSISGAREQKPMIAFDETTKPRREKQRHRVKFQASTPSSSPPSVAVFEPERSPNAKRPRSPSPSPSPSIEEGEGQSIPALLPDRAEENKGVIVDYTRLPMPPAPKKKRVVRIPSTPTPKEKISLDQ